VRALTIALPILIALALPAQRHSADAATGRQRARVDILVDMLGYPDLSGARVLPDKAARTRYVFNALRAYAAQTHPRLQAALARRGLASYSLWISNQIWVRGANEADQRWLAGQAGVRRVTLDRAMSQPQLPESAQQRKPQPLTASAIEWNVQRVNAPQVWALGTRGQNITVAGLDTGVQWDHPALKLKYRGWNGVTAIHDYNWYDAAGNIVNPPQSTLPISPALTPLDDYGHGSHTLGTVLGDDGAGNQIGVAPDAQWIGCRNMLNNTGSVARYAACFQFSLAPTDVNGNNPDPSRAADITNNSWGCFPPSIEQGCEVPTALITITQALRDAGIMVVASAGNSGSACSSIATAPGMLDQAFSVGATDSSNVIAPFSSRGPSMLTGRLKPDIVAPGVSVRSANNTGSYNFSSGTSMAGPHVAGVAALMWSAAPELRGEVALTEAILRRTSTPLVASQDCGSFPGSAVPNAVYGHGLLDAYQAVTESLRLSAQFTISAPLRAMTDSPVTVTLRYVNSSLDAFAAPVLITVPVPVSSTVLGISAGGVLTGDVARWVLTDTAPGVPVTMTLLLERSFGGPLTIAGARYEDRYSALYEPAVTTFLAAPDAPGSIFLPLLLR
jgi:subtilisin family serine protease